MIQLGNRVTDEFTGFEGIAVSRTEYLYGCVSIGVQPTPLAEKDGSYTPAAIVYFDEQRLEPDSLTKIGGPNEHPPGLEHPPG